MTESAEESLEEPLTNMSGLGVYTFFACRSVLAWSERDARQALASSGFVAESQLPAHASFDEEEDPLPDYNTSLIVPTAFEDIYGCSGQQPCDWIHIDRLREMISVLHPILGAPSTFPRVPELEMGREDFLGWCWSIAVNEDDPDENTTAYYYLRYPKLREALQDLRVRWHEHSGND